MVLSTSGLFLLAGAQFLAAGTVIVYAGAIIVTFLFVIMLAQMEGRAAYDRAARAPFRATLTCFLLFWALALRADPSSARARGRSGVDAAREASAAGPHGRGSADWPTRANADQPVAAVDQARRRADARS